MDNKTNNNSAQPSVQPDVQSTVQPDVQPDVQPGAQPVVTVNETMSEAVSQVAPKKKKTGLIIGLVAALLLIGGLIGGYLWYQSPNKVAADALNRVSSARIFKAKLKLDGMDLSKNSIPGVSFGDINIELTGDLEKLNLGYEVSTTFELMGAKLPVKAKLMLVDKTDAYFYLEDVSKTVDGFIGGFGAFLSEDATDLNELKSKISSLVAKIENKWVKFSLEDVKSDMEDEDSKALTCLTDVLKNYNFNTHAQQTRSILKEHKYYEISDVKTANGSFVMNVSIDQDKFKAYVRAAGETDLVKSFLKCGDEKQESSIEGEVSSISVKNTEWVISQWGHELKSVKTEVETETLDASGQKTAQTIKMEASFDWPKVAEIKAPSEAINFEDWIKDIEAEVAKMNTGAGEEAAGLGGLESLLF